MDETCGEQLGGLQLIVPLLASNWLAIKLNKMVILSSSCDIMSDK